MSDRRRKGAAAFLAAPQPAASASLVDAELRRLGAALAERVEKVCADAATRTSDSGRLGDSAVEQTFERICRSATHALVNWMGGQDEAAACAALRTAWEGLGELAVHRAISLNEASWRCFCWSHVMREVVRKAAAQLGLTPAALTEALTTVNRGLEVSLLGMCDSFEEERDHTDAELSRREDELTFLATHDPLTGLPNRALILDRTQQALARTKRSQRPVAALFIDLDSFKDINDTLGHSTGDDLLRAVAARLDGVVRGSDALGRLSGDEFVVISEDLSMDVGPELIAERLLAALAQPFKLSDGTRQVSITASIGIAFGIEIGAEELLRNADIAMYQAKWDGRNSYVVFEADMQETLQRRMELEMDLREALERDEFVVAYQPTIDLNDMRPSGMEALVRWQHPTRGLLQPDSFIPLLEETGLITAVGQWVLEEACKQGATWRAAGHPIQMAVNVSARQLDRDEITAHIASALSQSGLEAGALTIEITETALMRDATEAARRLDRIKELGVRVAIDDFGTGYSSIAQLQDLPIDALKIDRSFISGLRSNKEGETIVSTLIQLGSALSIETFAEGIEQEDELSILRAGDCRIGQGFLFSRPLEPEAAESFLREWRMSGEGAQDPPSRRSSHLLANNDLSVESERDARSPEGSGRCPS